MGTKILSVDDSRTIRRLVVRAFQPYDCTVCEAGNGEEGLAVAARERPDLIVLDVTMPTMDGVTMLTHLRADPELKSTPVIMLTAESGRENVLQIARLGIRDYLVKPFKDDQLIEKAGRIVTLTKKSAPVAPAAAAPKPAAVVDTGNFQELARQYGLPPVPESVLHLTQLVARQDSDLGQISEVISKDPALRARLLRLANPGVDKEADYTLQTVEEALMRNGVGCALLLAMSTPLALALAKTFQTMLAMKLETIDRKSLNPEHTEHVVGNIGFAGRAVGSVCLRLTPTSALLIASRILRVEARSLTSSNEVNDAVGELLNIITGNFKSNLCDAGLDCRLEPPKVTRVPNFSAAPIAGGSVEKMAFRAVPITLFVDVAANPWHGE
ncbi:MAG TPA: response regulator [Clostridia bacterium]|nr:response regulator [Clostridia bacterium]